MYKKSVCVFFSRANYFIIHALLLSTSIVDAFSDLFLLISLKKNWQVNLKISAKLRLNSIHMHTYRHSKLFQN
jgi:hypothetical protein